MSEKTIKKLTYLEGKILHAIAETHPYAFKECEKVYRKCKSFDETIKILKLALSHGCDTDIIMHDIYKL